MFRDLEKKKEMNIFYFWGRSGSSVKCFGLFSEKKERKYKKSSKDPLKGFGKKEIKFVFLERSDRGVSMESTDFE